MKTKKSKIIIGSRESKLAVLQSEMVRDYIKEKNPERTVKTVLFRIFFAAGSLYISAE